MKTARHFFSLMIAMAMAMISTTELVYAQGRGHKEGHENDNGKRYDKDRDHGNGRKSDSRDHYLGSHHDWDYGKEKKHRHDDHAAFQDRHDHYRHHPPVEAHHYARSRYIYYRDYNVYFDLHRNVYITLSGRHWLVTTSLPRVLHRVDIRRATRMEVNYDRDDLPRFLERQRPSYRSVYVRS